MDEFIVMNMGKTRNAGREKEREDGKEEGRRREKCEFKPKCNNNNNNSHWIPISRGCAAVSAMWTVDRVDCVCVYVFVCVCVCGLCNINAH